MSDSFQPSPDRKLHAFTLMSLLASFLITTSAFGQFSTAPSTTDPLDVSQGTIVIDSTPGISPGPEAAFGADLGAPEPGRTFAPNVGTGNATFIELQTSGVTRLSGVRIYAKNDGSGVSFRRALGGFRLLADTNGDGVFDTTAIDAEINTNYGLQPGNLATQPTFLELEISFPAISAEFWRVEFVQGVTAGQFSGVRIIEVDGITRAGGAIVQPVGISTTYRQVFPNIGQIVHTIDQSGMSQPYASRETDFDTYVASTNNGNSNSSMMLINSNGANQPNGIVETGGTITLDLGEPLPIDAIGVWAASTGENIERMAVHADDDGDFGNGGTTLLGAFDVEPTRDGRKHEFAPIETRFVHIEVLEHTGSDFIRHGEFAFRLADPDSDLVGDMNCDGAFDLLDVTPFVTALVDADAYAAQFPDCDRNRGDLNRDGRIDGRDTAVFVNRLVAGQ